MRVLGIDPGGSGALALYSPPAPHLGAPAYLEAWDIPTNKVTVGGSKRDRVDIVGLDGLLSDICMLGEPDRIVIEKVGAMPKQSGMFAFGYGVGLVHGALRLRKMVFEEVPPSQWKKAVKAPAEKSEAIVRAEELFPGYRHLWRYKATNGKDATRPDRAEAALIAYYGATCR